MRQHVRAEKEKSFTTDYNTGEEEIQMEPLENHLVLDAEWPEYDDDEEELDAWYAKGDDEYDDWAAMRSWQN